MLDSSRNDAGFTDPVGFEPAENDLIRGSVPKIYSSKIDRAELPVHRTKMFISQPFSKFWQKKAPSRRGRQVLRQVSYRQETYRAVSHLYPHGAL